MHFELGLDNLGSFAFLIRPGRRGDAVSRESTFSTHRRPHPRGGVTTREVKSCDPPGGEHSEAQEW